MSGFHSDCPVLELFALFLCTDHLATRMLIAVYFGWLSPHPELDFLVCDFHSTCSNFTVVKFV